MFGFGSKEIDVEFYLDRIKHILKKEKETINYKELANHAKKILEFIKYYIGKHKSYIYRTKLEVLKHIFLLLGHIIDNCDDDYCKEKEISEEKRLENIEKSVYNVPNRVFLSIRPVKLL